MRWQRAISPNGVKSESLKRVARPERFELPTLWFEARCSIQLSYGRAACSPSILNDLRCTFHFNFSGNIRYIRYN
jgi:hypothetical protein